MTRDRARRSAAFAAERARIATVLDAARQQGAGPRMPREAKVDAARRLSAERLSCRQIGDLLGMSDETIRLWLREAPREHAA